MSSEVAPPTQQSRAYFIPEVVQTSAMDCGPAALKSILEGVGISVSYGRLREACQTDVDGTSIDTLEDLAVQLGLDAEQVMVPPDHALLPEAQMLPAIAVIQLPSGMTHFIVIWRLHGPFVQVMDPAGGRRWTTARQLEKELYVHQMPVPADAFREYAGSLEFITALRRRILMLGASGAVAERWVAKALADETWRGIATLDATVRMVTALIGGGALPKGGEAVRLTERFVDRGLEEPTAIPGEYWTARGSDDDQVDLSGAVLVHVKGSSDPEVDGERAPLPPDLAAALAEQPDRPASRLFGLLRQDGVIAPLFVALALAASAFAVLVEALVFRGVIELTTVLRLPEQRMMMGSALVGFLVILLALQWPIGATTLRMGRHIEGRLRLAFLRKIPRLADRYFHSRLTSDMALRAHSVHAMRSLSQLGSSLLTSTFALLATCAGVIWLDPTNTLSVLVVAVLAVALPMVLQPLLNERDLRVQTLFATLTGFYLDALLGLAPLRAHGAQVAMRREHEGHLVAWERASLGLLRIMVNADVVTATVGVVLTVWLLFGYVSGGGALGGALLLVYWALRIPALGANVAQVARQYPHVRNIALRLLEPLGAPEETSDEAESQPPGVGPVSLDFENVTVQAGGQPILKDVSLHVEAGTRVGIVGASGAGKSTFVGLLLGWHRAAHGRVLVDGEPLSPSRQNTLRGETAWLDPAIQLWNRSLLRNLRYGSEDANAPIARILDEAELLGVLESLPEGLSTELGEGGALVSGGEGQRVRLGRAMMRPDARLVVFDEPFRGLDRGARRRLLRASMDRFENATMLFVTHDVSETADLDRVLVIDDGRIIEDGAPAALATQEGSAYRRLLEADRALREGLWDERFRRVWIQDGAVREAPP